MPTGRRIIPIAQAIADFEEEFGLIIDKFVIHTLTLKFAKITRDERVWKPGAYVWWNEDFGVIRVGRNLVNSRKRAFEHITDDKLRSTDVPDFRMSSLTKDPSSRLLLFNLRMNRDLHWAAAAEIFLELRLHPLIPSDRLG